ncbi:MAG: UDP-glucose/GDP-mannose dehydrogenase family protein [Candidatus Magasanikbacteria bacterium]|nr:UDP-glucose/GDP-mannose dehydrogenase family protein [Candidatus Magasanikbacteria bacterium]
MSIFVVQNKYIIAVAGLWHLGSVYAGCLADVGHTVIGWDQDAAVVARLQEGRAPLMEPQLEDKIKNCIHDYRLDFTTDLNKLKECNTVWVAFDTPVDEKDMVHLDPIWDFLQRAVPVLKQDVLVVISSQLPVGTTQAIVGFISEARPELKFSVAYVPENLQLGKAVESFMKPGRIVVGASTAETAEKIKDIFAPLRTSFLVMDPSSAEMSKHALNAFLATSLSFTYDIADLCQLYGADIVAVAKALRSDERIGPGAYLDASIGFSGGTLARDLKILLNKAHEADIDLPVIAGVFKKNKIRRSLATKYLTDYLGNLKGKKIAVFGLTYKPGTATLRRALALEIISKLLTAGAIIHAHDPMADAEEVKKALPVEFFANSYECAKGCQAVVIITNWPEFKKLNLIKLKLCLKPPYIFFDTRNFFYDQEVALRAAGFSYLGVGR